ncbi:hypothetical protein KI387_005745, partial [Taxus chinensis]
GYQHLLHLFFMFIRICNNFSTLCNLYCIQLTWISLNISAKSCTPCALPLSRVFTRFFSMAVSRVGDEKEAHNTGAVELQSDFFVGDFSNNILKYKLTLAM